MCVSRPTNPTGNVLTDTEIQKLSKIAQDYDIPLFIDNAYGLPWPNIIFTDEATPYWDYMPMNLLELDDGNYLVPLVSTQEYQKSDERACEALSYRSLLEAKGKNY